MNNAWYLNPLRWVDEDDLFDLSGAVTMHRAVDTLKDKLVHHPADDATMVRGLMRSAKAHGLTRKQQSAVDLAREAMQAGQTPTMYVAEKLNINRFSAFKLLKRADERIQPKMETFRQNLPVYSKAHITEADIKKQLRAMRIDCAGCGKHRSAPVHTALCRACLEEYGMEGERTELTASWLEPMIRLAWRDARKQAIDRLMVVDTEMMGA